MSDKEERKYECGFCGNIFTKLVGKASGAGDKPVSSQVQCKCGNFIPTWN